MAEPHGPPVITKARDLMTWLLNRISGFPRTHRFVLGERIGNLALDVLERLLEAAYSRQKGEGRLRESGRSRMPGVCNSEVQVYLLVLQGRRSNPSGPGW